jgi:hypothetical protein
MVTLQRGMNFSTFQTDLSGLPACEVAVPVRDRGGAAGSAPERACTADPSVPNPLAELAPDSKKGKA